MRQVPSACAAFVARHEALRLESYPDTGGTWTVGYGHTGTNVHAGMRITKAEAERFLAGDLTTAASRLAAVVKRDVIDGLTENQYSALLSFVFNLGCDAKWTIWKRLNAGQTDQVPAQMSRFVNVGSTRVQGLVNRRAAEVALWHLGELEEPTPPSSVTRAEPTPPTPEPVKPLVQQASFTTKAVGAGATGLALIGQFAEPIKHGADALTPYTGSTYVQKGVTILLTLAAACLIASLVSSWLKQRGAKH